MPIYRVSPQTETERLERVLAETEAYHRTAQAMVDQVRRQLVAALKRAVAPPAAPRPRRRR